MTTIISLHIAYDNPRRINITTLSISTATATITSSQRVQPPAYANYLEHAIEKALRLALDRGLPFSLEHVAIWLAHLSQEDVSRAYDRVNQRLFDEGYALAAQGTTADNGETTAAFWHLKQHEGYAHYWQQPEMVIA